MQTVLTLLFLTDIYPLWAAWKANRHTSLSHAVCWSIVAWAAWGGMTLAQGTAWQLATLDVPRYLALCLTGCAGVAVLGARRPGVAAWDFVVAGLLVVLLLPVAESLLATAEPLGMVRFLFLAATLAVGIVNYLPTGLAPAALLLAMGVAGELAHTMDRGVPFLPEWSETPARLCLALTPWIALLSWRLGARPSSEFGCRWLNFRDRYGLVWGQRVREQFNRSAANLGWNVHLTWRGLRLFPGSPPPSPEVQTAILDTFRSLLKRFDVVES